MSSTLLIPTTAVNSATQSGSASESYASTLSDSRSFTLPPVWLDSWSDSTMNVQRRVSEPPLVFDINNARSEPGFGRAPTDVRTRAIPQKVWEENKPPSHYFPDREADLHKEVYLWEGRRRVPRAGREDKSRLHKDSEEKPQVWEYVYDTGEVDDSTVYDEDLYFVEPRPEFPGPYDPERARYLYIETCRRTGVLPSGLFIRSLSSGRVVAKNQGLGPMGAHAVALSLITCLAVKELHLPGNNLGPEGMDCIAKLIHDNETIKVLTINDNNLGRRGGMILAACIKNNDSVVQINASGNCFDDETCRYFGEALSYNMKIEQLDLSNNLIGSMGLQYITESLERNHTLTHLDLSFNIVQSEGFKCHGYRGVQSMLKGNNTLLSLCLAWNGICVEGAKLIGSGLSGNNTLSVLDLSGCRLTLEALVNLIMYGKDNTNLKSLLIKNNPITNADLLVIVKTISQIPDSCLSFIDASSVTVSVDLLDLVADIGKTRPGFVVTYRTTFRGKDMSRNMMENVDMAVGDPLEALIKYTKSKNLRLVDLFSMIDTDKSGSVTRQELVRGVTEMGIPLSIAQMDKLVAKLDQDGDGEIDFSELLTGYKNLMRRLHKRGISTKQFKAEGADKDQVRIAGLVRQQSEDPGVLYSGSRRQSTLPDDVKTGRRGSTYSESGRTKKVSTEEMARRQSIISQEGRLTRQSTVTQGEKPRTSKKSTVTRGDFSKEESKKKQIAFSSEDPSDGPPLSAEEAKRIQENARRMGSVNPRKKSQSPRARKVKKQDSLELEFEQENLYLQEVTEKRSKLSELKKAEDEKKRERKKSKKMSSVIRVSSRSNLNLDVNVIEQDDKPATIPAVDKRSRKQSRRMLADPEDEP